MSTEFEPTAAATKQAEPRSTQRVLRTTIRVDDQTYAIPGKPVHVAHRHPEAFDVVEVWSVTTEGSPDTRHLRVFGTGHPVPPAAEHVGTVTAGPFVWHVFDVKTPQERTA